MGVPPSHFRGADAEAADDANRMRA
jgi:hypothetical protein